MSEDECARAIAYGMMAVEPGIDALAVGEMGSPTPRSRPRCPRPCSAARRRTGPAPAPASPAPARPQARGRRGRPGPPPRRRGDPFEVLRRLGGRSSRRSRAVLAARGPRAGGARRLRRAAAAAVLRRRRARVDHCVAGHARPSRAIAACSLGSACARCSISACGWARLPARRSRSRSSRPPPPATPAWRPSPRRGSAARLPFNKKHITDRSSRTQHC